MNVNFKFSCGDKLDITEKTTIEELQTSLAKARTKMTEQQFEDELSKFWTDFYDFMTIVSVPTANDVEA